MGDQADNSQLNPFVLSGVSPPGREEVFENRGGEVCGSTDLIWMTTEEAAKYLRISSKSLLNMASNGNIPYYKLQNRNRYLKSDLDTVLLSNRRGGACGC